MRWPVLVVLLSAAVGCGDNARPETPPPSAVAADGKLLVITTPPDASSTVLRRLDADTLAPRSAGVDLGEYHDAWAFSPDRRQLAVGTFGRTGVRLIDPVALTITRDVPLPVAAQALGWVAPGRVAVLLQRGGVVLVDARRGRIVRRWPLSYRFPCERRRQAVTPHGVVFVVSAPGGGAMRLLRVDADGRLRIVDLPRVRAPSSRQTCGSAAFAVDPAGHRAVVTGSRGPIAEVDLKSLAVTNHPQRRLRRALASPASCRATARTCTGRRTAVWATPDTVAITGSDWSDRPGERPRETPAGVALLDTRTWSARRLDRSAAEIAVTPDGTLVTFGGRRSGLRATTPGGVVRWTALRGERVHTVSVTATRVYAVVNHPGARTHVVDASTGTTIASTSQPLGRLELLSGRRHSGDSATSGP